MNYCLTLLSIGTCKIANFPLEFLRRLKIYSLFREKNFSIVNVHKMSDK